MNKKLTVTQYSVENQVAKILFCRPKEMNALNQAMREELLYCLQTAADDNSVKAIVLTGSGKSFGSGQDLSEDLDIERGALRTIEDHIKPIIAKITATPKPVISAVNGVCVGVSVGIALACDLAIMSSKASLIVPFSKLGLIPDGGITWHLARQLGPKKAYEIIISGGAISATECLNLGLVNKMVEPEELEEASKLWAESIATGIPLSMHHAKEAVKAALDADLLNTVSREALLQQTCSDSDEFKTAIHAFKNRS